jgi:hypothetical protein
MKKGSKSSKRRHFDDELADCLPSDRLEQNTREGPRRIVAVENQKSLEAGRAFLQGRADVDMDRITFVITGVPRNGQGPEDWLRAARGA